MCQTRDVDDSRREIGSGGGGTNAGENEVSEEKVGEVVGIELRFDAVNRFVIDKKYSSIINNNLNNMIVGAMNGLLRIQGMTRRTWIGSEYLLTSAAAERADANENRSSLSKRTFAFGVSFLMISAEFSSLRMKTPIRRICKYSKGRVADLDRVRPAKTTRLAYLAITRAASKPRPPWVAPVMITVIEPV